MFLRVTPYRLANSPIRTPTALSRRIWTTSPSVSFDARRLDPIALLPCRNVSSAFAFCVSQRKFSTRLLALSPSLWQATIPSGGGPTNASRTRRWILHAVFLPPLARLTLG